MSADTLQALRKQLLLKFKCAQSNSTSHARINPPHLLSMCSSDRCLINLGFNILAISTLHVSNFTTALRLSVSILAPQIDTLLSFFLF